MNLEEIKLKIKFIEEKKLRAIITLEFPHFVVKGFRVMESQYENPNGDKLWLVVPSYKDSGGKFHPIFFMPDKEQWKQLENKIWDEFYKQQKEFYKKRFDLEDGDII